MIKPMSVYNPANGCWIFDYYAMAFLTARIPSDWMKAFIERAVAGGEEDWGWIQF